MSNTKVRRNRFASRLICAALLCGASGVACSSQTVPQTEPPTVDSSAMEPQVAAAIDEARRAVIENPQSADAWSLLAMRLDAHGLLLEAAQCYQEAFALAPQDYRWAYLAGQALRKSDLDEALARFQEAERLKPGNSAFYVNYGDALSEAGRFDLARDQYQRGLELDPRSTHALYGLARLELAEGRTEGARDKLERAAQLAPNHGEVHTLLAQIHQRLGDQQRARESSFRAQAYPESTAAPDPVRARVEAQAVGSRSLTARGLNLVARNEFAEAERLFRKVLEIRPGNARDLANLGGAIAGQDRHDEAVQYYRQALELNSEEAYAHNNLALSLLSQGKTAEALQHADKAVSIDPSFAEGFHTLALSQARSGNLSAAEESFQRALSINPGLVAARNNHAQTLAAQGKLKEATAEWELARSIDPRNPETAYNLGIAFGMQGKHEDAIQALEQGLRLAPNSSLFIRALAWELSTAPDKKLRNAGRALELSARVYAQYPGEPLVADCRAAALAEAGRFQEAAEVANKALSQAAKQGNAALAKQIGTRVRLYQGGRPYRQAQPQRPQ